MLARLNSSNDKKQTLVYIHSNCLQHCIIF